jgi:hypothetical protein
VASVIDLYPQVVLKSTFLWESICPETVVFCIGERIVEVKIFDVDACCWGRDDVIDQALDCD